MATFDESTIRRDNSGRFAAKPVAAESGVDLSCGDRSDMAVDQGLVLVNTMDELEAAFAARHPAGGPRDLGREFEGYRIDGLGGPALPVEPKPPRSSWLARRREAKEGRKADEQASRTAWARTLQRHDAVSLAHAEHEADVLAVLERPTLTDLNEPSTERLYRAMVSASDLRTERHDDPGAKAYADAVSELDVAWRAANQHAERVRLSGFEPDERRRLTQAHALITKALDEAASPAERQSCYRKAMSLVDGLVPVPAPAAKSLRERTPLSLGS